jgi:hypothetical protein
MMSVINDKPSLDDSSKEKSIKFANQDSNPNLLPSGQNTHLTASRVSNDLKFSD